MARRQTGKHALLKIAGVTVACVSNVDIEVAVSLLESNAWGSNWKQSQPDVAGWKVTGKREPILSNIGAWLQLAAKTVNGLVADGVTPVTVEVWAENDAGGNGTMIFAGPAWCETASLSMPKAMDEENITLTGADAPTFVYAGAVQYLPA